MKIDLHCHTCVSDNSLSIEEVITRANTSGITHLAITDHDTTMGLREAERIGRQVGIEVVPGIEISAYDFEHNTRAHILGYYLEPDHPAIEYLCQPLRIARHEASCRMVEKLVEAGYSISWDQVKQFAKGGTGVYKQHIMHALIEQGYCEEIYSPLYKELFSRGDGKSEPGIAYIPLRYLDALDAIAAIRAAGGVPVLAHPGQFHNYVAVPKWVEAGLEGIEVHHPLHSEQDESMAISLARTYNLVMTGGSDFHGFYGDPEHQIGCRTAGAESIEQLKKLRRKR